MKKINIMSLILCILHSTASRAIELKITGPCSIMPIFTTNEVITLPQTLGLLTLQILKNYQIPYVGSEKGLNSIFNTPTGLDSIEVINDEELRAYGWCYTVNYDTPDLMPDQVKISEQSTKIHWFYAFSTSIRNQWVDYCVPAYQIKSPQFCENTDNKK